MSLLDDFLNAFTGLIFENSSPDLPAGFLWCDGSAVSRAAYPRLFAKIGITYGAGNGTTTFNVPDLRGRVTAGRDDMGGVAAGRLTNSGSGAPNVNGTQLGSAGGADRHALADSEMPTHSHDVWGNTSGNSANATGLVNSNSTSVGGMFGGGGTPAWKESFNSGQQIISSEGGAQAHPNVQPTFVLNKVIKT